MNGITNGARTFRFRALAVPSDGVELLPISGLLLRRAVLGTLLAAGRPLSSADVAAGLAAAGVTTRPRLTKGASRVIADLLAHQVRIGRVAKVGPALFAVVPGSMSRSTRQRCLRWRVEFERLRAATADLPPLLLQAPISHGSPLSDAPPPPSGASERGDPAHLAVGVQRVRKR